MPALEDQNGAETATELIGANASTFNTGAVKGGGQLFPHPSQPMLDQSTLDALSPGTYFWVVAWSEFILVWQIGSTE